MSERKIEKPYKAIACPCRTKLNGAWPYYIPGLLLSMEWAGILDEDDAARIATSLNAAYRAGVVAERARNAKENL